MNALTRQTPAPYEFGLLKTASLWEILAGLCAFGGRKPHMPWAELRASRRRLPSYFYLAFQQSATQETVRAVGKAMDRVECFKRAWLAALPLPRPTLHRHCPQVICSQGWASAACRCLQWQRLIATGHWRDAEKCNADMCLNIFKGYETGGP